MSGAERTAGWLAAAGALAYGLPHAWWGLGIMYGYPGSPDTIPDVAWQRAVGFWGMGLASVGAAFFALALFQPWGRLFPRWLLLVPAWPAGLALGLWGLGYGYLRFFIATGRVEPSAEVAKATSLWNYYWYPVFLIWGVSLVVSAWYLQRRPRAPRTD
ncbi:DUF3995 domain-containing protein [Streptomyces antimicrobicus]|uniref:DUF3995 domain-containing protein n=1 Tax=Streptomyces antimicrobicus TaxID=2883108 RepID=A0ABS8BCE0_9ACTN|nr:DUF3995 domain-containing protein [Streptomyces antimicrobicus]MCB5182198.1 DUF3995 domain-containing protein [Streptomyces antimicrobicus]